MTLATNEANSEVFGSVKITLMECFDERYAAIIEATTGTVVAAIVAIGLYGEVLCSTRSSTT